MGNRSRAFKSNKVRALLAYLAVEMDRPHRREVLAGLLWPQVCYNLPEYKPEAGLPKKAFLPVLRPGEGGRGDEGCAATKFEDKKNSAIILNENE
jgi:hypothetical protein